jgi:hypothetical protein
MPFEAPHRQRDRDSAGNAYITGYTYSTEATFPVTVGPDLIQNGGSVQFDISG